MRDAIQRILTVGWGVAVLIGAVGPAVGAEASRMTVDELKAALGGVDLIVLDVRAEGDWRDSAQKIRGAVRESPGEVKAWASKYAKAGTLVLYCA